jgi:hypothetical protein
MDKCHITLHNEMGVETSMVSLIACYARFKTLMSILCTATLRTSSLVGKLICSSPQDFFILVTSAVLTS